MNVSRRMPAASMFLGPILSACPRCGVEQEDHDGFGVLHCFACGYCTHAAVNGNRCMLCNRDLSREGTSE